MGQGRASWERRLRAGAQTSVWPRRPGQWVTFNVPVDYAVLMEDIDSHGDLLRIQPDDVLLQPQPGHLFQRALVTVLHEDVHFFLREEHRQPSVYTDTRRRIWKTPQAVPQRNLLSKGMLRSSS